MAEYIKREAVIDRLKRNLDACNPDSFSELCYRDAIETVKWFPAADVAPVVHGRWISFLDGDHIMPERYYRCSRCGRVESRRQPYCHCGAKMDGAE